MWIIAYTIIRNMWESISTMLQHYDTVMLRLDLIRAGLIGPPDTQSSGTSSLDEHDPITYLGPEPVLYIRKVKTTSDDYPPGSGPGVDSDVGICIPGVKVPDYGIRLEPLKWRELLNHENRTAHYPEIIERVNLLSYVAGAIFCDAGEWSECKINAKKTSNYGKVRKLEFKESVDPE